MNPFIQLIDVRKIYRPGEQEIRALDGISLTIKKGELIAIVGQSGSGKSTLMNILGCLDTPTSGQYRLDGRETGGLNDHALSVIRNREIGFIFQGFNLIPGLNALENVELPLMYRGLGREQRKQLAFDALDSVGLSGRIYHRPSEMSGGQQQRVAIARAIAAKPPIILADEPTGNLDSRSGAEVMEILLGLWQGGKTIVLITHSDEIAMQTERIIRIQDGRIIHDRPNQRDMVSLSS